MMPNASLERGHIEALKSRAAQILVRRHPVGGIVQMPAKELIQLLCERPAIDHGAAEEAVNELITEGKLSLHWNPGIFDGESQCNMALLAAAFGGAQQDPFDFKFVLVENSDWLDLATENCIADRKSVSPIDDRGQRYDAAELRTYLTSELCEELGVCSRTLNKYAKAAGVNTPRKGQRDHRYTNGDRRLICQAFIDKASDAELIRRCLRLIEN